MSIQKGRFMRSFGLIASVTAVFFLTGAQRFGTSGQSFPALVIGVGVISLVSAITSFLISANEYLEHDENKTG